MRTLITSYLKRLLKLGYGQDFANLILCKYMRCGVLDILDVNIRKMESGNGYIS